MANNIAITTLTPPSGSSTSQEAAYVTWLSKTYGTTFIVVPSRFDGLPVRDGRPCASAYVMDGKVIKTGSTSVPEDAWWIVPLWDVPGAVRIDWPDSVDPGLRDRFRGRKLLLAAAIALTGVDVAGKERNISSDPCEDHWEVEADGWRLEYLAVSRCGADDGLSPRILADPPGTGARQSKYERAAEYYLAKINRRG